MNLDDEIQESSLLSSLFESWETMLIWCVNNSARGRVSPFSGDRLSAGVGHSLWGDDRVVVEEMESMAGLGAGCSRASSQPRGDSGLFADAVRKGLEGSLGLLKEWLLHFGRASGLEVNYNKSSICFGGLGSFESSGSTRSPLLALMRRDTRVFRRARESMWLSKVANSRLGLSHCGIISEDNCVLCGDCVETVDHLIFDCVFAKAVLCGAFHERNSRIFRAQSSAAVAVARKLHLGDGLREGIAGACGLLCFFSGVLGGSVSALSLGLGSGVQVC
ncbi:hypothetical protein Dimus_008236 [Dionaea muscipula]